MASGLGAAEVGVGVGVEAALEIGFVGDGEPAKLGRGPGPAPVAGLIFRGARPTGGALVDMTAAIILPIFSSLQTFWLLASAFCFCFCFCYPSLFLVGDVGLSDRSWTVCGMARNGRRVGLVQRSQTGGLPFHWAVAVPESADGRIGLARGCNNH